MKRFQRFCPFILLAALALGGAACAHSAVNMPAESIAPEVATAERNDFILQIKCGLEDRSSGISLRSESWLTGFLYADGDDIFVVTAAHYREDGENWVWGNGHRPQPFGNFKLTEVSLDRAADTALLDLHERGEKFPRLPPWGDSDTLRIGDEVVAIGYDGDTGRLLRNRGEVINVNAATWWVDETIPLILHKAEVRPGFSGGPLINGRGEIVGMNIGIRNPDDQWEYSIAVPINRIRELIPRLRAAPASEFLLPQE